MVTLFSVQARVTNKIILTEQNGYVEVEMKESIPPPQSNLMPAQVYDEYDDEVEVYSSQVSNVIIGGNGPSHIEVDIDREYDSSGNSESGYYKKEEEDDEEEEDSEEDKEDEEEEEDDDKDSSWSSGSSSSSWEVKEDVTIKIPNPVARIGVTEVYSINNSIKGTVYRPNLNDIPELKSIVEKHGKFNHAGTSYYNSGAKAVESKIQENSRALEILGQDFLLSDEQYKQVGHLWEYVPTIANTTLTYSQSIMNIYKALGEDQYKYTLLYEPLHIDEMSAETQNMISRIYQEKNVDYSRGRTGVFVTRTNVENYLERAINDNLVSGIGTDWDSPVTGAEFIVMLQQFMDMYGEEQMSQFEEYTLLQLFGAEIPSYLSNREKDAYIYLRARGVLTENIIDFSKDIRTEDMLDILMRVKDKGSRHTFKNLVPTISIGDEAVSKGYFPKDIALVHGDSTISTETRYDYTQSQILDYYVIINAKTQIRDSSGQVVTDLYIPSDDAYLSAQVPRSSYEGIVDGELYHFKIPADFQGNSKLVINSKGDTDSPRYIELEYGGGLYLDPQVVTADDSIKIARIPFKEGMYPESVDIERQTSVVIKDTSIRKFDKLLARLATTLHAATPNVIPIEVDIYGLANIENLEELKRDYPVGTNMTIFPSEDKLIIKTSDSKTKVMSKVKLKNTSGDSDYSKHKAISSIDGDGVLIDYNELKDLGLFSEEAPMAQNGILKLQSSYGEITLDSKSYTVTVGNSIYKVPDDSVLFLYTEDDEGKKLRVDFRAAYGWSLNDVELEIAGDGASTKINIVPSTGVYDSYQTKKLHTVWGDQKSTPMLTQKNLEGRTQIILTAQYPLANYFLHRSTKEGLQKDYLYVYYLKQAFADRGIPEPTGKEGMREHLGFSVDNARWAIREVAIDIQTQDKVGGVSLIPNVGYVYTLPTLEEFNIDKYLKGEYLLPISFDEDNNKLIDHNVNHYKGTTYGARTVKGIPVPGTNVVETSTQDYKGEVTSVSTGTSRVDDAKNIDTIVPAPSGIMSYLPYYKQQYLELKDVSLMDTSQFFYGTMPLKVVGPEGEHIKIHIGSSLEGYFMAPKDVKVYRVGTSAGASVYSIASLDEILVGDNDIDPDKLIMRSVDGDKEDNKFRLFDLFDLDYLIRFVDWALTALLLLTIYVLPYAGYTALVILIGLSISGDNKVLQKLFARTVDPVEILTLGYFKYGQLKPLETLLSCILGAMLFTLLLDANALKIIKFVLEALMALLTRGK